MSLWFKAESRGTCIQASMLAVRRFGGTVPADAPLLIALHWLSGNADVWTEVGEALAVRGVALVAVDLPGFGESAGVAGYSVAEMRDAVIATVLTLRGESPAPWLLMGHSMGGKVAAAVARVAVDGAEALQNLRGLILISPSPPSPEPMTEKSRREVLESLGEATGDASEDRKRAEKFVDDNTGRVAMERGVHERAVASVLRMNRTAFRHWLESASKEDWSDAVGTLPPPALICAGSEEPALGPQVQQQVTAPHFAQATVVSLEGSGHLSPLERPAELVEHITEFLAAQHLNLNSARSLDSKFAALIDSAATSPQTRALLHARLADSQWNATPLHFTPAEFRTLRALAERVCPGVSFDLAARLDQRLGLADGWRFDALPDDLAAWRKGLLSLDAAARRELAVPFVALHAAQQDALLTSAREGSLGKGVAGTLHLGASAEAYTSAEMKLWFEDVRSEFARLTMADPRTYAAISFTGFADDAGLREAAGFTHIRLGESDERIPPGAKQ